MVARTAPNPTALVSTSFDPEVPAPTAADFIDRIVALRPLLRRLAGVLKRSTEPELLFLSHRLHAADSRRAKSSKRCCGLNNLGRSVQLPNLMPSPLTKQSPSLTRRPRRRNTRSRGNWIAANTSADERKSRKSDRHENPDVRKPGVAKV